jgi:hypothetical protein
MPFVAGYLRLVGRGGRPDQGLPGGGGPVDPDYGIGIEHPDQGLPEGPVDPGYGVPLPPVVSHPIPPTVWPNPPSPGAPPTYPVDPGYGLPLPPTVWPQPPRPVDPAYGVPVPIAPAHPIYLPPVGPNHDLPIPPGAVWPPLPPSVTGQVMCLVWLVGIGYRWTTIDASLKPAHPIVPPSAVPEPGHPIDPGGQPTPVRR